MSKYLRTYHLFFSKGATSDDKIADSVDGILGKEIVITEKLDGSNTCITKDGVYGRSHVEFTRNSWDVKSWEIYHMIKSDLHDDLYLFGEGMYGIHSIEYSNLKSYFYIFGIRDNNIWVSWDKVEEYSFLLDIPTVPVLFKGVVNTKEELKELVEDLVSKPSELGGDREGVVVRNSDMFHNDDFSDNVQKWVRKDHVTTDSHWRTNWKKAKLNI
jgi:ATP-dependent RNA circularization protein (DNA/RNA ligase family)